MYPGHYVIYIDMDFYDLGFCCVLNINNAYFLGIVLLFVLICA